MKTIVLVLKSGGDFQFRDVELIVRHITGKWKSEEKPRIICLWDKASTAYDLGNILLLPLTNNLPGTWSRIQLYSPEMEQYRPFLYVDLDTAIISSLENIFDLVKDETKFITLEDFWQQGQLATGLVWFPKSSSKVFQIWDSFKGAEGRRMDVYIRKVTPPDLFWQDLTSTIYDFKSRKRELLNHIPADANLICFHGKPRIYEAATTIGWVRAYVEAIYNNVANKKKATVIIPYKTDRGWLQQAVNSVPEGVQLLVSQGEGNWPANFNKVLDQAEGDYIRYLHEDDMLTPNCIDDSILAIEQQKVDFIHGNAIEIWEGSSKTRTYIPPVTHPKLKDMLQKNYIHSATLMYRREIFEKLGGFNEKLNTAEEYEFNLRCLKAGFKIGYCNTNLAYYRRHSLQKVRVVSARDRMIEREQVRQLYL